MILATSDRVDEDFELVVVRFEIAREDEVKHAAADVRVGRVQLAAVGEIDRGEIRVTELRLRVLHNNCGAVTLFRYAIEDALCLSDGGSEQDGS